MKIVYHIPSTNTIYAQRTIFLGYQRAFLDLGHEFYPFTAGDNLLGILEKVKPQIFMSSSHFYYRKFLDYSILKKYRDNGLFLLTKIDFWKSPIKMRINEARSLSNDKIVVDLIKSGMLGDAFYHVVEQNDPRMDGFEKTTGFKYHTIPLAADKTILVDSKNNSKFKADISYIGTNLPEKRKLFKEWVFPLKNKYDLRLYGQDWTPKDKLLGWVQRGGQYFNTPYLRSIQKPKLALGDEGDIYVSSAISINIHEDYQRKFGGDCNERTFKIPLAGGFEITDDVACIRSYFREGKEIIIAKNKDDWFDKIDYYFKNPNKRLAIINAGRQRVLKDHTYHNRARQIIDLCNKAR